MQLKIIRIRGQCRGHPPTRGAPRDELGAVVSRQSAVVRLEHWNTGTLEPIVVKRRWGEESSVVSRQSAVKPPGHLVHLSDLSALVVKRRCRLKFKVQSSKFKVQNSELRTQHSELSTHLSRDWVNHTCSVKPDIKKNRHKHRWRATCQPAGKWQGGRGMPVSEK